MISRILDKGLLIVAAVFALGLAASGQCSNASLAGKYGFSAGGLDKHGSPISLLGYINANGKGTFTGTETASDGGSVLTNVPLTGTYSIKSDCTGSGTSKLKGQKNTNHFTLVVVSGGKNLQFLSRMHPTFRAARCRPRGKRLARWPGTKGNFGIEANGVFIGVGAVALDGLFALDGKGNVSGTESGSIAGLIFTGQAVSGTYGVASKSTGTSTVTVLGQTEHSSFVVTNGGKGMLAARDRREYGRFRRRAAVIEFPLQSGSVRFFARGGCLRYAGGRRFICLTSQSSPAPCQRTA